MSNINIETKNGVVIVKKLMITDYNDREIGTTGFEVGDLLVVHSKDESENCLAVITAVQLFRATMKTLIHMKNFLRVMKKFRNF